MKATAQNFPTAEQARRRPLLKWLTCHFGTLGAVFERGMETGRIEPASELGPTPEMLAELDQQMAREIAAARILNERLNQLAWLAADKWIAELESELGSAREELLVWENNNHSLQTSLEMIAGENSRLFRRLAESDVVVDKVRSQIAQLKTVLRAAEAERNKLAAVVNAANKKPVLQNSLQAKDRQVQELEHSRSKLIENATEMLLAGTITL